MRDHIVDACVVETRDIQARLITLIDKLKAKADDQASQSALKAALTTYEQSCDIAAALSPSKDGVRVVTIPSPVTEIDAPESPEKARSRKQRLRDRLTGE